MRRIKMYPIMEKFISINGEGAHTGELAAFIRFRGCNLQCSYCDTRWANSFSAKAQIASAEELTEWAVSSGVKNVTLTGGEPLLQDDLEILIKMLIRNGMRVEIETNGSIPLKKFAQMHYRPVFTMDYKLPSSGMEKYMCTDNFRLLNIHDTVKFVSGTQEDLERAVQIINEFDLEEKCHIYFSPVFGGIDTADMVKFMIDRHMKYVRLQLQMHKYIWDPQKRGV